MTIHFDTLIPARRKGVYSFSIGTSGLLIDPIFHVSYISLSQMNLWPFTDFLSSWRYKGCIGPIKRILQFLPSKIFNELEGCPSIVLEIHCPIWELVPALLLGDLFELQQMFQYRSAWTSETRCMESTNICRSSKIKLSIPFLTF